jgi:hypothetical protein
MRRFWLFLRLWARGLIGADSRLSVVTRLVAIVVAVVGVWTYPVQTFIGAANRQFIDFTLPVVELLLAFLFLVCVILFAGKAWVESGSLLVKIYVEFDPNCERCVVVENAGAGGPWGRSLWLGLRTRGPTLNQVSATLLDLEPRRPVGASLALPAQFNGLGLLNPSGRRHVQHIKLLTKDDGTNNILTIMTATPVAVIDDRTFTARLQVQAQNVSPTEVELSVLPDTEIPVFPTVRICRQRQVTP